MPDSFDDDKLKKAIMKADEYYLNSLPQSKDITHQFSNRFETRMRKLIRQSKKKEKTAKPLRFRWRTAVLLAGIIILLVFSMSVSAVRITVFELISNVYEKYTEIFFDSSQSIPDDKFIAFKPSYIPNGFKANIEDLDGSVYLEYVKDDDYIIYEQKRREDVSTHINTEGVEVEFIEFNERPARYYSNQGTQNLIWYDDSYMYSISSTLDKNEVYKIAEGIQ